MPIFASQRSVNGVFSARFKRGGILPWALRQIITTGYVAGGYKDNVAWRNVNKYTFSNDTASNLGDLLHQAVNYTSGAHNRNNAFIWGTNGTGSEGWGAHTSVSAFNMRNDTTTTKPGNLAFAAGQAGTAIQQDLVGNYTFSWQTGGQAAAVYQKWNLVTETHQGTVATTLAQDGVGSANHFGENVAYWWGDAADSNTAYRRKFVYATESETTPATAAGAHSQQRGQPAKNGFGYGGNEGNYGSGRFYRKWNYTTEVSVATPQKSIWWCGEENYTMSQTHGIMLGHYSDTVGGNASAQGQVNDIGKYDFSNDTGFRVTSTTLTGTATGTGASGSCCPNGQIGGRSSGHGYWRD